MAREQSYGYFPGGSYDPRDFDPDRDVNTPGEIAAWETLCASWERGGRPEEKPSGRIEVITLPEHRHHKTGEVVPAHTGPAILCGSSLGMGTFWVETDDNTAPRPSLTEWASVDCKDVGGTCPAGRCRECDLDHLLGPEPAHA